MFKVLVVDDSAVMREFLAGILETDPALQVVGTANSGEEAIAAVQRLQPDVITMDINMPKMDGFEATRQIMEIAAKPIVIVTGAFNPEEVATSFRAVEAGAVAIIGKPPGANHPEHEAQVRQLIRTVKAMAEVKVVRRWARSRLSANNAADGTANSAPNLPASAGHRAKSLKLVAIGASTGGPLALKTLLTALPHSFPVPVLIVQHMAAGFIPGFAEWLAQSTKHSIHVATNGETLLPTHIYIAPDGFQMKVKAQGKIELTQDKQEHGLSPSVSYLFRSVAEAYGPNAAGVLLTGMGRDGAAELKLMYDRGAITFVQNKETSIIHGMPGEAIRLGAAMYELAPAEIASALVALTDSQAHHTSNTLGTNSAKNNPARPNVRNSK